MVLPAHQKVTVGSTASKSGLLQKFFNRRGTSINQNPVMIGREIWGVVYMPVDPKCVLESRLETQWLVVCGVVMLTIC